jgi:dTDP-4-amino-4,6-dideoxygalactose transaminase
MNEMQAALACSQLKRLNKFITKRRKIAKLYDKILFKNPKIYLPQSKIKIRSTSALHLYIICLNLKKIKFTRSKLIKKLKDLKIGTQIHYIPVHKFNAFKKIKKLNNLNNTEKYYKECVSIPCYFDLPFKKVQYIAKNINNLLD